MAGSAATLNDPRSSAPAPADRSATAPLAAVLLLDSHGHITSASQTAGLLFELAPAALLGRPFASLFVFDVHSAEADWPDSQWEVLRDTFLNSTTSLTIEPPNGAPQDVQVRLERIAGETYLATLQAPPAAVAAVDRSGFQLLSDHGAAGYFDLDLSGGRVTYSRAWKKTLGYVDSELPDTLATWRELIHPDDSAAAPDQVARKHTAGARPFNVEFRMRHRLGHWVWIQCVGVQVINAAGQPERVVGVNIDISERKELEETSLANDERMDFLSSGPLGAFDFDFANRAFWLSPA